MATGMPELGSKISLISKADIRYEGRLFTVDPSECTIALANVRSHGTEDRESQFPIAPQNLIYDYILFRGSDIKDIRVVNTAPAMPQDPSIIQITGGSQMGVGGGGVGGPMGGMVGGPMGALGVMGGAVAGGGGYPGAFAAAGGLGGAMGGFNAMGGLGGPLGPGGMGGMAPGATNNMAGLHKSKQTTSVLDLIGGGSRSTTPISLHSRKSPELGMQQQQRNQPFHGNNQLQQQQLQQRGWTNNRGGQPQQQQQQGLINSLSQQMYARGPQQRGGRGGRGGPRGPMNQMGGYRQSNNSMPNGTNPNRSGGGGRTAKPTTIKFESDYDFEQANNKFEELRLELANLKVSGAAGAAAGAGAGGDGVGGGEPKPEQANGEADKKDDSGNETGAGEHGEEDDEVAGGAGAQQPAAVVCYDKAKSFFDSISCEAANDRTKGKNRTDWRHERKINSETFGVSARRGGFFNYRGRGGYYNRNNNPNNAINAMQAGGGGPGQQQQLGLQAGPGGPFQGGYRQNNPNNSGGGGGYRQNNSGGGGGYRGSRPNNRNYHQSQSTGIPVQPTGPKQPGQQQQQSEQPASAAAASSSPHVDAAAAATTSASSAVPAAPAKSLATVANNVSEASAVAAAPAVAAN